MLRKLQVYVMVLVLTAVLVPGAMAFTKDSLVWKKCTGCHEPVSGKIARVEAIRTTPEEWTVIVDRMSRLHGMDLTKAEMDLLLKELCTTQILSPAELEKVAYLNLLNNPQHVERPHGPAQEKQFLTCVRCHSAGKIFSYRMPVRLDEVTGFPPVHDPHHRPSDAGDEVGPGSRRCAGHSGNRIFLRSKLAASR